MNADENTPPVKNHLDSPTAIRQEPEHQAARDAVAKLIREAPDEFKDPADEEEERVLTHTEGENVFFLLTDIDDDVAEVSGLVHVVLEAKHPYAPDSISDGNAESPPCYKGIYDIDLEWSEHVLSKLPPEQRVSAIRHAYSVRLMELREMSESDKGKGMPEIERRIHDISTHYANAVERVMLEEREKSDVSWPPNKPPSRLEVIEAWSALHPVMQAYLKRLFVKKRERHVIDSMEPRHLRATLLTDNEEKAMVADETRDFPDVRPCANGPQGEEEPNDEMDNNDNDGGGDLAESYERYHADTNFVLSLSYEKKSRTTGGELGSSMFQHEVVRVTPDEALHIVSSLSPEHRKTIADAVVWQFIQEEGEGQFDEEYGDGGVAPLWRERSNDPALDPLLICPQLKNLYMRMVFDDRATEEFPDDPNAPKEPKGT